MDGRQGTTWTTTAFTLVAAWLTMVVGVVLWWRHTSAATLMRGRSAMPTRESQERGASEERRAKEIAARTSAKDVSPEHRGGKHSGNRQGSGGPTKAELYEEARRRNIKGRSKMTKQELQRALGR